MKKDYAQTIWCLIKDDIANCVRDGSQEEFGLDNLKEIALLEKHIKALHDFIKTLNKKSNKSFAETLALSQILNLEYRDE